MPKTNRSEYKVNGYVHPEKKLLRTDPQPMFSDDEAYLLRQAKSTVRTLKMVLKEITDHWKGKDRPEKIGKEIFKLNSKLYDAEQEVERRTKG